MEEKKPDNHQDSEDSNENQANNPEQRIEQDTGERASGEQRRRLTPEEIEATCLEISARYAHYSSDGSYRNPDDVDKSELVGKTVYIGEYVPFSMDGPGISDDAIEEFPEEENLTEEPKHAEVTDKIDEKRFSIDKYGLFSIPRARFVRPDIRKPVEEEKVETSEKTENKEDVRTSNICPYVRIDVPRAETCHHVAGEPMDDEINLNNPKTAEDNAENPCAICRENATFTTQSVDPNHNTGESSESRSENAEVITIRYNDKEMIYIGKYVPFSMEGAGISRSRATEAMLGIDAIPDDYQMGVGVGNSSSDENSSFAKLVEENSNSIGSVSVSDVENVDILDIDRTRRDFPTDEVASSKSSCNSIVHSPFGESSGDTFPICSTGVSEAEVSPTSADICTSISYLEICESEKENTPVVILPDTPTKRKHPSPELESPNAKKIRLFEQDEETQIEPSVALLPSDSEPGCSNLQDVGINIDDNGGSTSSSSAAENIAASEPAVVSPEVDEGFEEKKAKKRTKETSAEKESENVNDTPSEPKKKKN